ncbi:MAG: SAM-dependent DNA methyltransferase [Acholeplasmatales bacterium]|jgi:site-specific DNA-methyltransferase (adenine-specific)|nr:SAM-dependent DNA methyltransferase [Acholeplasmatales bacterium]MCI9653106.1 SAM-dependent DNA methyltransferase [Acholeplasmatales bacterium]
MQEMKTEHLELFYDCVDQSNDILYEAFHKSYFDLIEMTVQNILAGEVVCDCDEETKNKLNQIYDQLVGVDFTVEDVRKAMQAIFLKGFKEMRILNGNTTPDTLGIFIAYLITKLNANKKITILDPLCGTGNLLHTVINHLDKECTSFACDHDVWMTKLTKMVSDLLGIPVELYLQDTRNLSLKDMDCILFDMPNVILEEKKSYFPYEAILHYKEMLKPDGAMIAILGSDFFNYDKNQEFKKQLLQDCSIIGLIELPDSMFVAKPKIILVIQKCMLDKKNCFMVKLPSFTDVKEFNKSLMEIEAWFENNKNNRSEENK